MDTEENQYLAKISETKKLIQALENIEDVKELRDKSEALRFYYKGREDNHVEQQHHAEIKIRCERRIGELLRDMELAKGTRGNIQDVLSGGTHKAPPEEKPKTLAELGLNKKQSSHWQLIARLDENIFEAYLIESQRKDQEITSAKTLALAKRLARKAENQQETINLTSGKVSIVKQDAISFLSTLKDQSIDLLLTDPPYITDVEDIENFVNEWVLLALSKIKPTGRAYIFTGSYPQELQAYLNLLNEQSLMKFKDVLVWAYNNTLGPQPSHVYKRNWQACFYLYGYEAPPLNCPKMVEQFAAQTINAPDARTGVRYHAWQKPDELAERLIKHSTVENDLVIDPFAGSGTFLAAAAKLNRMAYGCEISQEMLDICTERGLCFNQEAA